jgi:hypothetical protein
VRDGREENVFAKMVRMESHEICPFIWTYRESLTFSLGSEGELTLNVTQKSFNRCKDFRRGKSETTSLIIILVLHEGEDIVVDVAMKFKVTPAHILRPMTHH